MILNSDSVELIRANSLRLAHAVRHKDDLVDLATASSFEQVFSAIETLLTNTEMYFDDELLLTLDTSNWQNFKALLLVYTLNVVNRKMTSAPANYTQSHSREFGASLSHM